MSSHNDEKRSVDDGGTKTDETLDEEPEEYPSNHKRVLIMTALYLSLFLVTLDQNVISTAIPRITDQFHSLNDVGWYGTAYLLTMCSFQLLMGKVYKYYPAKPIFLAFCLLFEIGSAICGAAPNSNTFIAGRAISGLGSTGMFGGVMVILFYTVPLQQRPIYQGAFGAVFAIASVIGPLVGGSLTDHVTWRWCFYINLPIGGVSMIVTMFLLHMPNQKLDPQAEGWYGKIKQLDPIGNLAFFPGIVCLVLALQWGGTEYSWKNWRIILLIVMCALLVGVFVGLQIWKGEEATIPPRIIKNRNVWASVVFGFFNGAGMMVVMYYIPIWFQAIKGASAIHSGIMMLPTILATVISMIATGVLISKVGYYAPFFWLATIVTPIGAGLFTTFTPSTSSAKWIGFQILYGVGLGFGAQQPLTVVQTVLARPDVAQGSALIMFTRFLGSAIFLPVAQTVFINGLVKKASNISGIDPNAITHAGATELRNMASGNELKLLLGDYNDALVDVFYMVTATSCMSIIGCIFIEWKSMRTKEGSQAGKNVEAGVAAEV
ncbi:major facilitator superfamily domain-containing protein [Lophiotrema nucula]|uniref:Major facilitator superfamily domain-containing protein n=1 Tax=Lophiotrema nucula TaxID=690887 RepID=A0A6A5ZW88_9PLEO|nr:major facilitator superfamily domain-containing protein [Lophiotrema nucula]